MFVHKYRIQRASIDRNKEAISSKSNDNILEEKSVNGSWLIYLTGKHNDNKCLPSRKLALESYQTVQQNSCRSQKMTTKNYSRFRYRYNEELFTWKSDVNLGTA